uniref:Uncharacterized protein n=1 Tax=Dicentrarchus labrax TaxID=13489 RepID=A0A8P4KBP3_DICLA
CIFLTNYSLILTHTFVSCVSGVHCGEFKVTMPETIEVLSGSCVTIPLFEPQYDNRLSVMHTTANEVGLCCELQMYSPFVFLKL